MKKFLTSCASMLVLTLETHTSAQAAEEPVDQITVTATKTERLIFTTPAAVSVIESENIETLQPFAFQDIFETIPGVEIQGGGRRIAEEPSIRGFADEQVVIRLDGARQNFNLAHRGRFFTDPDLLKRIEIVKGSSSALYGSGALGGVISMESKGARDFLAADESLGGRIKAGYQSNGNQPSVSAGLFARTGNVDAFANVVYREVFDDLEDGRNNAIIDSKDRVLNYFGKIGANLSPHSRFELIGDIFDNEGQNPANANDISSPTTVVGRDTESKTIRGRYTYDDPDNRWLNISATAYHTAVDVTEDRIIDARADRSNFKTTGIDLYNVMRLTEEQDLNIRIVTGFEYYVDRQNGVRDGAARPQFPDAEMRFAAGYAQAEITAWDRLTIIPGLRWDNFNLQPQGPFSERTESEVTPRISVGFEAHDDIYFWGGYSEAFRAPSLTEFFADGVHFVVPLAPGQIVVNEFIPTPDLRPEKATTYEIGARFRHAGIFSNSDSLQLEASYYRSKVDDLVDQFVIFISGPPRFTPPFGPLVFPGITSNRNVDARIRGAEAAIQYDSAYFFASVSGHVIDGDNRDTGEGLASIPAKRLNMRLERKLPAQNLRIGFQATLGDSKTGGPAGTLATPAYETGDLYLSWAPEKGILAGMRLTARIDNIWNENYTIHPSAVPQPGRSFRLSIGYRFAS